MAATDATPPARRRSAVQALLQARAAGLTLRQAAQSAGVHVATVCRWQNSDPALRAALEEARAAAREAELLGTGPGRASVRWRRDCPLCRARVVVRTARGVRFWRCGRWPRCEWASWRPRAPRDCRHCGSPCFWSHSRRSIGCGGCGRRVFPRRWAPEPIGMG
ncbi:MAG TPA: hypothetical protein VFE78_21915 [Gemmataceae bacterium]|jgi:hypothetical protein|nr:hypothetical protein [Gemmataceae bacterium]